MVQNETEKTNRQIYLSESECGVIVTICIQDWSSFVDHDQNAVFFFSATSTSTLELDKSFSNSTLIWVREYWTVNIVQSIQCSFWSHLVTKTQMNNVSFHKHKHRLTLTENTKIQMKKYKKEGKKKPKITSLLLLEALERTQNTGKRSQNSRVWHKNE